MIAAALLLTGCHAVNPPRAGSPAAPPPATSVDQSAAPAATADRLAAPVGLRFPDTALPDAPVLGVGVTPDGQMEVPVDVNTVGWYRFGPPPGAAAGAGVLAGHVDDAAQGPGAFHQLDRLVPDDRIEVQTAGGAVHRYEVVSVSSYTKESLPVEQMFSRGGPPRLHLITCGGPFDAARASYRDNVVVVAERRS